MPTSKDLDETTGIDNPIFHQLRDALSSKRARIGVIGMGYVGIPLAMALIRAGFEVIGFDTNEQHVDQINSGKQVMRHISPEILNHALNAGTLTVTADLARLGEPDAVLICVPTPLNRNREPDLSFVVSTAQAIAAKIRPGQLVVLESTTYPGTTIEVLKPIIEQSGLVSGRDFFLAFSPEREDPGNAEFQTSSIPKVIGGDGADALALAQLLYGSVIDTTVPVSSPATAEAVKLTENIFRAVNIALVNELKIVYDAMGVDIWEVIEAAKTKPFGYMPFYPGPGLGGHCIPIDPFYLTWKAREHGIATRFIELAGEINTAMPDHVAGRLTEALATRLKTSIEGSRILMLGLAYKKNISDTRESPALQLMELMEKRGAQVEYHDPFVPVIPTTREHAALAGRRSVALSRETIDNVDAVLIVTDHDEVDYGLVTAHAKLVVDTRNVCARKGVSSPVVVKA